MHLPRPAVTSRTLLHSMEWRSVWRENYDHKRREDRWEVQSYLEEVWRICVILAGQILRGGTRFIVSVSERTRQSASLRIVSVMMRTRQSASLHLRTLFCQGKFVARVWGICVILVGQILPGGTRFIVSVSEPFFAKVNSLRSSGGFDSFSEDRFLPGTCMRYDPSRHHRQSIRLRGYDYVQEGAYFVTICTYERECALGEIKDGTMMLSGVGEIAATCWLEIPRHFPNALLDEFAGLQCQ